MRVTPAAEGDLPLFLEMEKDPESRRFIFPYTPTDHRNGFADPDIVYLRITCEDDLAGFFILVREPDGRSVEFRREIGHDEARTGALAQELRLARNRADHASCSMLFSAMPPSQAG